MSRIYFIYMLTNVKNNVLYTGVTNDIIRRVYEHKNKLQKGFTAKYYVNKLVYYEMYSDITEAIAREKQIKGWTRKKKDNLIKTLNPLLRDLYEELC
ncbi:MAG TPA: GIY-YIG nuclease family protein [Gammaproteobacteria bacterium]|nr:GIY-YIG nuclease family protein [Gammaproteobacteria bacterium]